MKELLAEIARRRAENPDLTADDLSADIDLSDFLTIKSGAAEHAPSPSDVALDQAALLSAFDLDALVAGTIAADRPMEREKIRSSLLRNSSESGSNGLRSLHTPIRQERIEKMHARDGLDVELALTEQAARSVDDPHVQHLDKLLRDALRGMSRGGVEAAISELLPSPELSTKELRARLQVLSWIIPEDTGDPTLDALLDERRTTFRQLITEMETRERLRAEADQFVGREPLLEQLMRRLFLDREGPGVPIVAMQGIGGIGKSAILAALVTRLRDINPELLVARIDFDRPGFGTATPDFLTLQIVEQLAAQAHMTDHSLLSGTEYYTKGAGIEAVSENTDRAMDQFEAVRRQIGLDRPTLLILDTLEERQRHGPSIMSQLSFWLEHLTQTAGSDTLAVIVAGRARPDVNDFYFPEFFDQPVDDLNMTERRALLSSLLENRDASEQLAPISGNPLLLHLVARLVTRQDGPSVDELVGDGADVETPAEALQGMIYDRILSHVEDDRAKDLAYPGLILREVTPGVIADVIAPAVIGRAVDPDTEGRELFEALRKEVWLVEDDGPDRVRHRMDVRRLMMEYLETDDTVSEVASEIHRRAVDHFHANGERRERNYHKAMIATPEELQNLSQIEARQWLEDIGGDIDYIPKPVRATLMATAGARLSEEEIAQLPDRLWRDFTDSLGPELVAEDDLRRAKRLWSDAREAPRPPWLLRALEGLGEWPGMDCVSDSLPDLSQPQDKALFVRLAMRNDDWHMAYGISRQVDDLTATLTSTQTVLVSKTEARDRDISSMLELIFYNMLAEAHAEKAGMPQVRGKRHTLRKQALRRAAEFVHPRLLMQQPALERLDRRDLYLLEELHRIHAVILRDEGDFSLRGISGASRFQFVPSLDWIDIAHRAAREAREHLSGWGSLSRRISTAVEEEGSVTISNITQSMASDAISVLQRLPPPYQRMPLFQGAGYREHRLPLRFALSDAIGLDASKFVLARDALLQLCKAANCIIPRELTETTLRLPGTVEGVDLKLVPILHYADQCGLLPAYARDLCQLFPECTKLVRVEGDLSDWAQVLTPPNLDGEANQPVL